MLNEQVLVQGYKVRFFCVYSAGIRINFKQLLIGVNKMKVTQRRNFKRNAEITLFGSPSLVSLAGTSGPKTSYFNPNLLAILPVMVLGSLSALIAAWAAARRAIGTRNGEQET